MFDDLLAANRRYASELHNADVVGRAGRGLAVLTCMDSRIDPLAALGLSVGDAKIFRNAGARVTDDALRSLILAVNLLGAERILVMQHTQCAMASKTDAELREAIGASDDVEFLTMKDQAAALRDDIERIRACPYIPSSVAIAGFVFDVRTGELQPGEG